MHLPVLFEETMKNLVTDPGGIYVDCTLGGGGHFKGILDRTSPSAVLVGIDQDSAAIARVEQDLHPGNARLVKGNFRYLASILNDIGIGPVDGILVDLGVSSFQLDEGDRGFSFHNEARLDMRMDAEAETSAWEIVNQWPEDEIKKIIREYGEERYAGRIARGIVTAREKRHIESTLELVDVIRRSVPAAYSREVHPARRTFQAIRMAVNRELEALEALLPQGVASLKVGGRICVISFHSLEDRMVKAFFVNESKECLCPPKQPICNCGHRPALKLITRKPIVASAEELEGNSRARSARLRIAEKRGY